MKIKYTPSKLPIGPKRYTSIIIHDSVCKFLFHGKLNIDTPTSQVNIARSELKAEKNYYELPYHFVCEKTMSDFETIVARPLQYSCQNEYPDLDIKYSRLGIHVCVMGNFNMLVDESRMYQQVCYRVIAPMMKLYHIPRGNIFMHGELSTEVMDCPGLNFDKHKLLAFLDRYRTSV